MFTAAEHCRPERSPLEEPGDHKVSGRASKTTMCDPRFSGFTDKLSFVGLGANPADNKKKYSNTFFLQKLTELADVFHMDHTEATYLDKIRP